MTDHITPGSDELEALRRIIFEHTSEDLETRLRMAVTAIRGDTVPMPKKVWTDLLGDIYEPFIRRTQLESRIDELKNIIDKYATQNTITYGTIIKWSDVDNRIAELEAERRKLGGGGEE